MTKQEAFNKVWNWFLTHPRCVVAAGSCVYTHGDNHCAIGCLLSPQALIDLGTNSESVVTMNNTQREIISKDIGIDDLYWLRDLQNAHDTQSGTLRSNLTSFARGHSLEVPQ